MAYTFLKAQGHEIGKSLLEADKVDLAKQTLADAKAKHVKILLPVDHVVADKVAADARIRQVGEGQPIPADMIALDIGPKSVELFAAEIGTARTIVWNGPMGVFEIEAFAKGTKKIANAVAENGAAISIVGGGDSVAAVKAAGVADKISHISTGGGASLEFLEGKKLPGVEALSNK
jgi:phosphoglycerate kinase